MILSHLVALSNNLVIGVNNDLPWKLKKDLQHFSAYTQNKAIVMGRKTFESIGRPLPNRKNIVISSTLSSQDGIEIVKNLDLGINAATKWNLENAQDNEVVLIGGGYVFEESKDVVNKLTKEEIIEALKVRGFVDDDGIHDIDYVDPKKVIIIDPDNQDSEIY